MLRAVRQAADPTAAGVPKEVRVLQNADFGNTRGIDVRLDRRFGNYFSGTLAYTYQQAKNTGDDPSPTSRSALAS